MEPNLNIGRKRKIKYAKSNDEINETKLCESGSLQRFNTYAFYSEQSKPCSENIWRSNDFGILCECYKKLNHFSQNYSPDP